MTMIESESVVRTVARAHLTSLVMRYLGPQFEAPAGEFADRVLGIIERYAANMRLAEPDDRLMALGAAVNESCEVTLGLAAAILRADPRPSR